MQPVEIKKDIFWVGCVDYDHRDFHGYSRSPEGSTYNAYLIRDEKNVLMDTVYPGWAGNMLCRIAKIMDPEKIEGGYKVTVGSVAHPMDENHYIEWIELLADNQSLTCFLKPGDKPEAVFKTDAEKVTAREYCNLHGHWKAEN